MDVTRTLMKSIDSDTMERAVRLTAKVTKTQTPPRSNASSIDSEELLTAGKTMISEAMRAERVKHKIMCEFEDEERKKQEKLDEISRR